jgi:hypothetical protein
LEYLDEDNQPEDEEGTQQDKPIQIDWNIHYAALLKYRKEHGHCNVPYLDKYECDLPGMGENGQTFHYYGTLGSWLTRQRRYRKGLRGTLQPEREALLQKLVDEGKFSYMYCVMILFYYILLF